MDGPRWTTTDLCLDLWCGADGTLVVLDEDELREAEVAGWTDEETVRRAREEAEALLVAARAGAWPPREVREWTLERARAAVARMRAGHDDEPPENG
jgi:predicted RNA-binding protein associated with RNAse of E/G family